MEMKIFGLFIRFFPFFAIATNLFNFLYLKFVSKKMNAATKKFLIYSTGSMFVWGMLQLIGGYGNCFFILLPPWDHPLVAIFWVLYFVGVWGFAAWMMVGDDCGQVAEDEGGDGNAGVKSMRTKMLGITVMSSIVPVVFFLGQVTGVIEPIDFESLFSGLDIPWP